MTEARTQEIRRNFSDQGFKVKDILKTMVLAPEFAPDYLVNPLIGQALGAQRVFRSCKSCHDRSPERSLIPNLDNLFNDTLRPEDRRQMLAHVEQVLDLANQGRNRQMPPRTSPALTTEQMSIIQTWLRSGAPNLQGELAISPAGRPGVRAGSVQQAGWANFRSQHKRLLSGSDYILSLIRTGARVLNSPIESRIEEWSSCSGPEALAILGAPSLENGSLTLTQVSAQLRTWQDRCITNESWSNLAASVFANGVIPSIGPLYSEIKGSELSIDQKRAILDHVFVSVFGHTRHWSASHTRLFERLLADMESERMRALTLPNFLKESYLKTFMNGLNLEY